MAEYEQKRLGGLTYSVPKDPRPRKRKPPLIVVMNESCNCCAGSPVCQSECPVDCIHIINEDGRPHRVYVDNNVCIGCLNCFSYEVRPKNINKGDVDENIKVYNNMDLSQKVGVCPWDAIEIHKFEDGERRSAEFYEQPTSAEPEVSA